MQSTRMTKQLISLNLNVLSRVLKNGVCSFMAMTIAITVSFKLVSFLKTFIGLFAVLFTTQNNTQISRRRYKAIQRR